MYAIVKRQIGFKIEFDGRQSPFVIVGSIQHRFNDETNGSEVSKIRLITRDYVAYMVGFHCEIEKNYEHTAEGSGEELTCKLRKNGIYDSVHPLYDATERGYTDGSRWV